MSAARAATRTKRQSTSQTQVLGWIASGDVLRDDRFVYRAVGRPDDIDDIVYQLDAMGLVELLADGRVITTPAGARTWTRMHSRRYAGSRWHQLQFIPASAAPLS